MILRKKQVLGVKFVKGTVSQDGMRWDNGATMPKLMAANTFSI
jgi:hypothetical protein